MIDEMTDNYFLSGLVEYTSIKMSELKLFKTENMLAIITDTEEIIIFNRGISKETKNVSILTQQRKLKSKWCIYNKKNIDNTREFLILLKRTKKEKKNKNEKDGKILRIKLQTLQMNPSLSTIINNDVFSTLLDTVSDLNFISRNISVTLKFKNSRPNFSNINLWEHQDIHVKKLHHFCLSIVRDTEKILEE